MSELPNKGYKAVIPNPFDLYPLLGRIAFYVSVGVVLLPCLATLGLEIYRGLKKRRQQDEDNQD